MIANFMGTKIINLPEVQPVDALEDDDFPIEGDVALLDEAVWRGEEAEAVQVAAARPPDSPHELPHGAVKEEGVSQDRSSRYDCCVEFLFSLSKTACLSMSREPMLCY